MGLLRLLIIERQQGNYYRYFVASKDVLQRAQVALKLMRKRWTIEQGYQQLKAELGIDHFEGRSWPGLHHHVILSFMAFGFLKPLQQGCPRQA